MGPSFPNTCRWKYFSLSFELSQLFSQTFSMWATLKSNLSTQSHQDKMGSFHCWGEVIFLAVCCLTEMWWTLTHESALRSDFMSSVTDRADLGGNRDPESEIGPLHENVQTWTNRHFEQTGLKNKLAFGHFVPHIWVWLSTLKLHLVIVSIHVCGRIPFFYVLNKHYLIKQDRKAPNVMLEHRMERDEKCKVWENCLPVIKLPLL